MIWGHFQIGRLVACVREVPEWPNHCTEWPRQGHVYTIADARMGESDCGNAILGLRFREFDGFPVDGSEYEPRYGVWYFPSWLFRPLDDARLAPFRRLLDAPVPLSGSPSRVPAEVLS